MGNVFVRVPQLPGEGDEGVTGTKVTPEQWEAADWSLTDAQLARTLSVSRERVRQKRKKLGKPPGTWKERRHERGIWARIVEAFDPESTSAEIAKKADASRNYVGFVLRKSGLEARKAKMGHSPLYNWDCVDWNQLNVEIARQLGAYESYVSYRRKLHAPPHLKKSPYKPKGGRPSRTNQKGAG